MASGTIMKSSNTITLLTSTNLADLVANQENNSVRYYYISPSSSLTDYPDASRYHLMITIMKKDVLAQVLIMAVLASNPLAPKTKRAYVVYSSGEWSIYWQTEF